MKTGYFVKYFVKTGIVGNTKFEEKQAIMTREHLSDMLCENLKYLILNANYIGDIESFLNSRKDSNIEIFE